MSETASTRARKLKTSATMLAMRLVSSDASVASKSHMYTSDWRSPGMCLNPGFQVGWWWGVWHLLGKIGFSMGSVESKSIQNFFLWFYLFIQERHRERQRQRERQKQAPCGEPDVGLDPRTLGSYPEPKADAQPLNHPGVLSIQILSSRKYLSHTIICNTLPCSQRSRTVL